MLNFVIRFFNWFISLPSGLIATLREIAMEKQMEQERVKPYKEHKRRGGGNRPKDTLGVNGELIAAKYLRKKGFKILHRNAVMPSCELDLVVLDRKTNTLRFVEVKTRRSDKYQKPWQAVDQYRKTRMSAAAKEYIRQNRLWNMNFQFDIISIVWPENAEPRIEHLENAFPPIRPRSRS